MAYTEGLHFKTDTRKKRQDCIQKITKVKRAGSLAQDRAVEVNT
jgi:hypothetical protein